MTKQTAYSNIQTTLEALSLEIVLANPADPMAFKKSLALLKKIHIEAKKHNVEGIAVCASDAAKLIQKIRKNQVNESAALDDLNIFVVEMKALAGAETAVVSSQPTVHEERHKGSKNPGPRHPSNLPPHLSLDDFEIFLASKIPVLEALEALILEFESGNTKEPALEIKRLLHTMKGECGFLSLEEAERLCHRTEDLLLMNVRSDFAELLLQIKDWFQETFGCYARGYKAKTTSREILSRLDDYASKIHCRSNFPPPSDTPFAPEKVPQATNGEEATGQGNGFNRPIQIDARRLDQLIDIIGELAIAEAMVSRGVLHETTEAKTFGHALKALGESTKALQKIGLSLRMVPLKPLFNRMKRVARDLAKKQNKEIQFIIQGESAELDKNLVDGLAAPLIHIIRNCIDHGIEADQRDRIQSGKPETATLTLKGFHKGGNLYIEITDDGRGINKKKLLERAVAAGFVEEADKLDSVAILNLIFHSGLSTAEQVTDISGRGIGMDVVRTTISQFNGTISLASEQAKGTSVTIKLPLTLSILDGMVIALKDKTKQKTSHYVLPTLSIVSALAVSPEMIATAMGENEYIRVREELIPLLNLDQFFNPQKRPGTTGSLRRIGENTNKKIVVIVEDAGIKAGLLINELVTKQSFVRKPLPGVSKDIPGVSGATILADGRVCLILDTAALVAAARGKLLE